MSAPRDVDALALRYEPERDGAPRVVAKGGAELAERILALARESGVPIREDPDLLACLAAVDVGAEVPEELFAIVAELLVYLYELGAER